MTDSDISAAHERADRPASKRKIAKILGAARAEFFANGFSAASIEAIAARAEVSKVTVYTWFQTKENLFGEVVKAECDQMHQNFDAEHLEGRGLREILVLAATNMLGFLTQKEKVRFDRILASEVNRDPRIGEYFLDNGPRRLLADLVKLLQVFVDRGEIQSENLTVSAEMLAGLVLGRLDLFLRYGAVVDLSHDDKVQRAERGVDAWLMIHRR